MTLISLEQRYTVRWLNTFTSIAIVFLLAATFWIPSSNAAALVRRDLIGDNGDGVNLRVLPIGDSITFGIGTVARNSYRKSLYEKLSDRGNQVDFVGIMKSGDFDDRDNEGHRGATIRTIGTLSGVGIAAAPNIVLLHAGTNNMKNDDDANAAISDLRKLINQIFDAAPKSAMFVAQIIPAKRDAAFQARLEKYNAAIPDLVAEFAANNKRKIAVVPINGALTTDDLDDDLHPKDTGYEKMAKAWYAAIDEADKKGWITEPGIPTAVATCASTPSWYNAGVIAQGAKVAYGDGDFIPYWSEPRVIAEGACPRSRLHFMDFNGDGLKDYACVHKDTSEVTIRVNIPDSDGKSSGNWEKPEQAKGGIGRPGSGVMFADLNGDGYDDFIYVNPDGEVDAWINTKGGSWNNIGQIAKPSGIHLTIETLQMGDIDGDGRDDLLYIGPDSGAVTAWLNRGGALMPDYYKLGIIATGQAPGSKVRIGDFTGEGRADYMTIGVDGKVHGSVNHLQEEAGLIPRWLPSFVLADGPSGADRDSVFLVDMTGDGKLDYLLVDEDTGKVRLWENKGKGGKYQPGEGAILCDLDGDDAADYLWMDQDGKGWIYLNVGKGSDGWSDLGQSIAGTGHKREQIRMAVLTKSGRADYVVVESTGAALWWQNVGGSNIGWKSRGQFATGQNVKSTVESHGWHFNSKNIRFADLTGDGIDDYLYVSDTGGTLMWKHQGNDPIGFDPPVLVADGPEGVSGVEVQFADTNGDGLLDYVVVDRVNGFTRVWHNLGFRNDGSIRWNTPINFAERTGSAGFAIKIVDMTGDFRYDYVSISPDNGRVNLWKNRCSSVDTSWGEVDCTLPEVTDAGDKYTSKERWEAVGADAAFDAMISNWKAKNDSGSNLAFAPSCSNFWHSGEDMHCEIRVTGNGCTDTLTCKDSFRPAGYLILNSMANINRVIGNMYDALFRASEDVGNNLDAIGTVFKAEPPKKPDVPLILEIVGLAFALFAAPMWNSVLKKIPTFEQNGNTLGTLKDGVNGAVANSITIAKGRLTPSSVSLDPKAALGVVLSSVVKIFYEALSDMQYELFNGKDENIKVIRNLMTDGAMTGTSLTLVSDADIQHGVEKALYGILIPTSWLLSAEPVNVAVVRSKVLCGDDHPTRKNAVCRDGYFWELKAAIGAFQTCKSGFCHPTSGECDPDTCTANELSEPPGLEDLNGEAYGGLKPTEIIKGAINTWVTNHENNDGNSKDGKGLIDLSKPDDLDFEEFNVEHAGIITIPVCTREELQEIWEAGPDPEKRPNYPCP